MNKLKDVFGKDFILLEELESLDNELKKKLAEKIKYLTIISEKGTRRDEEKILR